MQARAGGGSGAGGTGAAAMAVVPTPAVLRELDPDDALDPTTSDTPATGRVDVLLDLSADGVASPVPWASEVWRFRYGEGRSTDPVRALLVDYIRHPGRSRVFLVAEPGERIVREGWLSWWRGEQLDRILLDPVSWPATAALDRLDPEPSGAPAASAEPPQRRSDPGSGVPRSLLGIAAVARRGLSVASTFTRHDDWQSGSSMRRSTPSSRRRRTRRSRGSPASPVGSPPTRSGSSATACCTCSSRTTTRSSGGAPSATWRSLRTEPSASPNRPGSRRPHLLPVPRRGPGLRVPPARDLGGKGARLTRRWISPRALASGRDPARGHPGGRRVRRRIRGRLVDVRDAARSRRQPQPVHLARPPTHRSLDAARPEPGEDRCPFRPAGGTPFVSAGKLYRPSQDDSHGYGGRVVVNEVEVLTPRAFAERPVRWIEPPHGSPYRDGLHAVGRGQADPRRRERAALRQGDVPSRRRRPPGSCATDE